MKLISVEKTKRNLRKHLKKSQQKKNTKSLAISFKLTLNVFEMQWRGKIFSPQKRGTREDEKQTVSLVRTRSLGDNRLN